ncbi:hypothetical protein PtA15_2A435 [Puccinia triticina]|uniref:Uncharacterized protein n=2 Tax=Puccinia triticina TaxID=208348 RepID=A0ABY7CH65_9BASI|nr:uncharacterized protein PtA15_2A435 [Puccinia triticina]WAQ82122.1 hypothetical protein PtA15_2A435 [Puccinia triticina]WAR52985.1 hypothetical protein PtB15_2B413 [Puccinia triticina]
MWRSAFRLRSITESSGQRIRSYNYDVDLHGRVYLSEVRSRNFTNCYRDVNFLNILFKKLRKINQGIESDDQSHQIDPGELHLNQENFKQGYRWVSKCQGEINYIRSSSTPIVYKTLDISTNELMYGGSLKKSFEPSRLKYDRSTGWLFHPSPSAKNHGCYSLLSSSILSDSLQDSIDLGSAGWIRWGQDKFPILPLDPDDLS